MELLLISLSTAFNFGILRWKLSHGRYADTVFDVATLIALSYMFAGTLGGMIVAMCSGALISIYLIFNPIQLIAGDFNSFKAKYIGVAKKATIILLVTLVVVGLAYGISHIKFYDSVMANIINMVKDMLIGLPLSLIAIMLGQLIGW